MAPLAYPGYAYEHKHIHGHQRTFRIIITSAATARNIRLIAQTIITSHTGIAYPADLGN